MMTHKEAVEELNKLRSTLVSGHEEYSQKALQTTVMADLHRKSGDHNAEGVALVLALSHVRMAMACKTVVDDIDGALLAIVDEDKGST